MYVIQIHPAIGYLADSGRTSTPDVRQAKKFATRGEAEHWASNGCGGTVVAFK